MKNRHYAWLALCLSLLIGLSACGSRETEPQGTTAGSVGTEAPTDTECRETSAEQPTDTAPDAKDPEDDGYSSLIPLAPRED